MAKRSKSEKKSSGGKGRGWEGAEIMAMAICPLAVFGFIIDSMF